MLVIALEPHENRPNVLKWDKTLLTSTFVPSAPYTIVTESDCNLFGCDRTDTIVYLPATLTDGHVNAMINMNLNILNTFDKSRMISTK